MFNRCWRWRVLLARRSDGALTPSQWGSLQDHLVSCTSCRKLSDADAALQAAFNVSATQLSPEAANAFDARVVASVQAGRWRSANQPSWAVRQWKRIRLRSRAWPIGFLAQIGGGAACAVTLTSFFLLPALHPHAPVSARTAQLLDIQEQAIQRANASVPMESLLQTPTPRAAWLWTPPQNEIAARHRKGSPDTALPTRVKLPIQRALPKSETPAQKSYQHHSALPNTRAYG